MKQNVIPVFRPYMDNEEKESILRVLETRWWGLGPETAKFEEEFLAYLGTGYGVATNSGTAALHMALFSMNLKKGDEVIVPSFTFVSSATAISYVGVNPVFADIERSTLTIDPASIEDNITDRTKAIIVVHYGGQACDMDTISEIANKHNLLIVEDCAHAAGAEYKGKKLGTIGDISAFSFHAVKNLATGDGGMLVGNQKSTIDRMRAFRWVGITKTTWDRYAPSSNSDAEKRSTYDVEELGYKYHMNDIQAAIARVQLKRLDKVNQIRYELVQRYRENLEPVKDIELLETKNWGKSSNHLFVILSKKRDKIMKYLNSNGIATSIHYTPVHKFSLYKKDYANLKLPVTERVSEEVLTLPLFPDLKEEEVEFICNKIKEAVK
jgi:perosamine synthetase